MPRPHSLLWLVTATSCPVSAPDDGAPRRDDTAEIVPIGEERALSERRVRAELWHDRRGTVYVAPEHERVAATQLLMAAAVAHALGETDAARLPELAHAAGLVVERWRIDGRSYLALLERPALRGSIGSFLLRMGPRTRSGPERLLQAPHVFHDVGTGELGLATLLAAPDGFRGLFVNTLHRYMQADGTKRQRDYNPADVCHNDAHAFVAATVGAVRALGHVEVVQLHGFGEDHALPPDRSTTRAVVSAGDPEGGSARVAEVVDALQHAFGGSFARYPEDLGDLGGTTNVIGRRVRAEPEAGFLHLELSSEFRKHLRRRTDGPALLAAALGARTEPEAAEAP